MADPADHDPQHEPDGGDPGQGDAALFGEPAPVLKDFGALFGEPKQELRHRRPDGGERGRGGDGPAAE